MLERCVCRHQSESYRNAYPVTLHAVTASGNLVIFKNKGTSVWKIVPSSELSQFFCFFFATTRGQSHELSTVRSRTSSLCHTERPRLFITSGRESPRHALRLRLLRVTVLVLLYITKYTRYCVITENNGNNCDTNNYRRMIITPLN